MAVSWERFYAQVQPHVPGCPEIVIDQHLQQSAADFCERSEVWRHDLDTDYTTSGLADYAIDAPTGAFVENITALYLDGALLTRVSDLDFKSPSGLTTARPTRFSQYQDRQIRLFPTPDRAYAITGTCVLKPKLSATGVEDFIFESHGATLACGALASLLVIPNKEWTNPELGAYYAAKFHKMTDDAKGRDTRRANFRVKNVGFA